jgi:hypothetical protein
MIDAVLVQYAAQYLSGEERPPEVFLMRSEHILHPFFINGVADSIEIHYTDGTTSIFSAVKEPQS